MRAEKQVNISFIGGFYLFGAAILLVSLITGSYENDTLSIASAHGFTNLPEVPARIVLIVIAIIIGFGILKLYKWAFWVTLGYCFYYIVTGIHMGSTTGNHIFYENIIFSIWVVCTLPWKRKLFEGGRFI